MKRFEGNVAIVTGGANGIGLGISKRLASEGARVVIADVDADALQRTQQEIEENVGGVCTCIEADMSNEAHVQRLVDHAVQSYGTVDIIVNNAARFVFADAAHATEEDWDRALATNVKGYAFAIKHASRVMIDRGRGGSIVNIASTSSFIAQPGFVPYSTTKGAILQLSKCSALDLGPYNIRVNAVCPGPIMTEGTRKHAASLGKTLDEVVEEMQAGMIIKRMGSVEEVAAAVAFIASSEASFITGTTLLVDGGYTAL